MQAHIIGDKASFAIAFRFFDDTHETELALYLNGVNILKFERNGKTLTTRWDLDELVLWLKNFIEHMAEDPYPVNADGQYAAIKDINARCFDSDDDGEFDAYYDKLDEWNLRHRWHTASSGAVLADVYFQLVGTNVEVSWNNQELDDDVRFSNSLGGATFEKGLFLSIVNGFLKEYDAHWHKAR